MNLLFAAAAVLTLALAGIGVLRIVFPRMDERRRMLARLAPGYCVGCGLVAMILFVAYLARVPFSRVLVLGPVGALAVYGAFVCLRKTDGHAWRGIPGNAAACAAGGVLVLLGLALSWSRPVYGYDALSMWALKAKVTFFARSWPTTLFDPRTTHHPEYPPLVPAAQAFVFFFLGEFDDVASRVVFAAFYAVGGGILWWWMDRFKASMRGVWLLWWFAVPLAMEQVKTSYADLPLAVYLLVFYGAVVAWLREPRQREWLELAAVFGGLAFWVKEDALIGVGGGCVALVLVARMRRLPPRPVWMMILITALIAAPWPLLVWWKRIPAGFVFPASDVGIRLPVILRGLLNAGFVEGGYAFFWTMVVLVLVFRWGRLARAENVWLALSVAFGLGTAVFVYLGTKLDLAAQLKTSADRVLLSLFVPALLLTALLWRTGFGVLRSRKWNAVIAVLVLAIGLGMFWIGLHRKSDEEIAGITISAFPLALTWVWVGTAGLTLVKFVPTLRRARTALVWRATQFAVVVATFGLALVSVGVYAREAGELRRRFGGKTLAEQHAMTVDQRVREQLEAALRQWPAGTPVRVSPKRSLLYHQFYYESFPRLVVDDSADRGVSLDAVR